MENLKTIFITGANRGIGLELVKESLTKNYFVIGTYRNKEKSDELLQIKSNNIKLFEMDVVNEDSIINVSKNIKFPIDYLICNAGINNGYGNIYDEDHSHNQMLEVLNVNVLGCILTVRHIGKHINANAKII